jgi:hypothetical protein
MDLPPADATAAKKASKPKSPISPISDFLKKILQILDIHAILTLLAFLETSPFGFNGYTIGPEPSVFYAAMSGSITTINCISWMIFVLFRKDSVNKDDDRTRVHVLCESILQYIYANHRQSPELKRLLAILSTNLNEVESVKKFPLWFTVSLWIICSVSSGEDLFFPGWSLTSSDCYKIWQFLPVDHRRQILHSPTLKKWFILALQRRENPPQELVDFFKSSISANDVHELDLLNILCGIGAITSAEFVNRIFHDSRRSLRGKRMFFNIELNPNKLAAFWRRNLPSIFQNLKDPGESDDMLFADFFSPGWLSLKVDLTRVDAVDLEKYIRLLCSNVHINSTGVFDERFFVRFSPEIQKILFSTITVTNLLGVITLILYPGISGIPVIFGIEGAPFNLALYKLVQDYMQNFASWQNHDKSYFASSIRCRPIEYCFYSATSDLLKYMIKQNGESNSVFWIFFAKKFVENLGNLKKRPHLPLDNIEELRNLDLMKIDSITSHPSFSNMLFKMFGFPFFNFMFRSMKFSGAIGSLIPIVCDSHFVDPSEVLFLIQQMALTLADPSPENYQKLMQFFDRMNKMQLNPSGRFSDFQCKLVSQFAERMSFRRLTPVQVRAFFENVPKFLISSFFGTCKRLTCFKPIDPQPSAKRSKTERLEALCSKCSNWTRILVLCYQPDQPDQLSSVICTECALVDLIRGNNRLTLLQPTSFVTE